MINEISYETEPLNNRYEEDESLSIYCGRMIESAIDDWVRKYGKARVVAAIVSLGLILTMTSAGSSIGIGYWYINTLGDRSYPEVAHVSLFTLPFFILGLSFACCFCWTGCAARTAVADWNERRNYEINL